MYVMIDNYDSFVYNLAAYFRELGQEIRVIRRDRIIPEELEASASEGQLEGIDFSGSRMSGGGRKASGDRAELGGQGSRAGRVSGSPDYRPGVRGGCCPGQTAGARESDGNTQQRKGPFQGTSGYLPGHQISFAGH